MDQSRQCPEPPRRDAPGGRDENAVAKKGAGIIRPRRLSSRWLAVV